MVVLTLLRTYLLIVTEESTLETTGVTVEALDLCLSSERQKERDTHHHTQVAQQVQLRNSWCVVQGVWLANYGKT